MSFIHLETKDTYFVHATSWGQKLLALYEVLLEAELGEFFECGLERGAERDGLEDEILSTTHLFCKFGLQVEIGRLDLHRLSVNLLLLIIIYDWYIVLPEKVLKVKFFLLFWHLVLIRLLLLHDFLGWRALSLFDLALSEDIVLLVVLFEHFTLYGDDLFNA